LYLLTIKKYLPTLRTDFLENLNATSENKNEKQNKGFLMHGPVTSMLRFGILWSAAL